ncbi:MAG: acetyl-CoA C-acyltransferase [Firmicutes bacterium HGW-Firmicutes-16]|nr:MAG: acetyl-CoA C-acyltransferase [Firmicutes bacterium HGW-Firmicutes-16]
MREAVVVAYGRSAIGKSPKGTLKDTRPEDFAAQVVKGVLAKVPTFDPALIDDVILGCAFQEAETGTNVARSIVFLSGIPDSVPAQTINRFCSSGLQAISMGANAIRAGEADVILAGGVETMSMIPMGGNLNVPVVSLAVGMPETMTAMGNTAENVADKYGITREMQDAFAVGSHAKAAAAQEAGKFDDEIITVDAVKYKTDEAGRVVKYYEPFNKDEGIRYGLTMEQLTKLKPVFQKDGTVTAGNASQMNDAASVVLLMSREKAEELGLKPIAKFVSFAVAGVDPAFMGIGPTVAVPKALKFAGLNIADIDVWELNEAFASQAIACVNELGLDPQKVNPNGGGIALGHPLGCTGAMLTCKLLSELKRTGKKYGVVSMCIGGGMGAAGVYEMCT